MALPDRLPVHVGAAPNDPARPDPTLTDAALLNGALVDVEARPEPSVTVALADVHMHYRVPSVGAPGAHTAPRGDRLIDQLPGRGHVVDVHALDGVSFATSAGESVGVLGLNGSGKSTLLRVIAGLEPPSRGKVYASSPPSLLGVNAALLPELSGAQNVHLGCLAMGMTPEQARDAMPGVAGFADIGEHLNLPMSTYSSGMAARLRFAIALAAMPDILLIDEALATGDAAFKERSRQRMDEVRRSAGTVFLVSHAAMTIQEECTRALWLHRGRVVLDGPAPDVAERYRLWAWKLARGETSKAAGLLDEAYRAGAETIVNLVGRTDGSGPVRHTTRRSSRRHWRWPATLTSRLERA